LRTGSLKYCAFFYKVLNSCKIFDHDWVAAGLFFWTGAAKISRVWMSRSRALEIAAVMKNRELADIGGEK